ALRFAKGDYSRGVTLQRRDEVGVLAGSLDQMRAGIAQREQEILRLAYQDTLTTLPNRALFNERLDRAIENAKRTGESLAIFVMDLDRFKYVNDTLGHAVGDHVLQEVARRLQETLRVADTIARLGGDEFAIMLTTAKRDHLTLVVNKIMHA